MSAIDFKADLPEFREKTAAFYAGEMTKQAYKGFSGYYGSYAQKGAKASMLRLRMPAGCRHTIIADTELKVIEVQLGREISVQDKHKWEWPM